MSGSRAPGAIRVLNGKAWNPSGPSFSGLYFGNSIFSGARPLLVNWLMPVDDAADRVLPCQGMYTLAARATKLSNGAQIEVPSSRPGRKPSGAGSGAVPV